ncbi:histidine phosphatase family protein [Rhizobacter sp. LjRoot28]|uniref:histidine phosphatase family protein n=1 Tax=Rhizobacter sp. LjRoot28 TaxID=3342309 RepID=UPI003ECC7AFE
MKRRSVVLGSLGGVLAATVRAQASDQALSLLRQGGVVLVIRHALAPGNFDPPGFRLGDCSTQRNLSDEGRAQARALGERLRAASLVPAAVRSSPWCRCIETAELAFGRAEPWAALGSPRGGVEVTGPEPLAALRQAVVAAARQKGRFDVWVTHMFVLSALLDTHADSGEGLVLAPDSRGKVAVLARLPAA